MLAGNVLGPALQVILADASDDGILGAPEELPEMHRGYPVP